MRRAALPSAVLHAWQAVLLAGFLLGLAALPALALNPDEVLDDPALETRARALSKGLRCVVCQNQSIDDSDAGIARDMRLVVRERLVAGDTDEEVRAYLVERYGEFVLLRPRMGGHTVALWAAPVLFLAAGAFVVWRRRGTGRAVASDRTFPPLDEAEEREIARLTKPDQPGELPRP